MAIPCCRSFYPQGETVPKPVPFRINGAEVNTLWPSASVEWQDYTEEKGAANAYHFRLGPFYVDAQGETDWLGVGGPYASPPGGAWGETYWQKNRDLVFHAYEKGAWVEVVPIDSWGCKHSQGGSRYVPWLKADIDACGRTWRPEHERYARKVVEELGCFGNVTWALDNEGQNIQGWQGSWYRKLRDVIRDEETKTGCGFRHLIGTGVGDLQREVDYSITHVRAPLTAPIENRWTIQNEHNPQYSPADEQTYFATARNIRLTWALWRADMDDAAFENTLARFKAVVEGQPPQDACPKPLAPGATVYLNNKPYGQGFDSTPRVRGDPEFCRLIHGTPMNDCHLEGWPQRVQCEMQLMHGCPIWQYTMNGSTTVRCLQPAHPDASCDHWGTAGGALDDPHTPAYEGRPIECGSQRVNGYPAAGFFTIAHGKAQVRACKPDGTGCGPWLFFDHAIGGQ